MLLINLLIATLSHGTKFNQKKNQFVLTPDDF